MRESFNELLTDYQMRRTIKQKQHFIKWLNHHARIYDYTVFEHNFKKGKSKNLIIGSPEEAEIFLTAHYDTPSSAWFPILSIVGNIPLFILSQISLYIVAFLFFYFIHWVLSFAISVNYLGNSQIPFFWFTVPLLTLILMIFWSIQLTVGLPNKKNANDNTSGVSVLISLLEDLPVDIRNRICFVFFDDEEKGLEGAKCFNKGYGPHVKNKPLLNYDCVGHGKHLVFISRTVFSKTAAFEMLKEVVKDKAIVKYGKKFIHPSDQMVFKNSAGVVAVHKFPLVGYYMTRLHSRFDTKFNPDNIEKLNEMTKHFIQRILIDNEENQNKL